MATLTVRHLPDEVRDKLRVRAARRGRSMEAEAREVLAQAVQGERLAAEPVDVATRARRLQETMKPYRPETGSVADEILADRRDEVRRERESDTLRQAPPSRGRSQAEKLAAARAILRRHVPDGVSLVDEFLLERRSLWRGG